MVPIVPLILINGAEGIATGWATSIPLHHPLQVIDAVESLLRAPAGTGWQELPRLDPWFLGFKGRIEPLASGDGFETHGVITRVRRPDPGNRDKGKTRERMLTFHVTELPVGRWTEDFHKTLNSLCADNIVDSFIHNNTKATLYCKFKFHIGNPEPLRDHGAPDQQYAQYKCKSTVQNHPPT